MNKSFTLSLSLEQVNLVLVALSKLPYEASAPLIEEVQKQAQAQVQTEKVDAEPVDD